MLLTRCVRSVLPFAALSLVAVMAVPVTAAAQDAAQVKKGEAVYAAQKCSMCHVIAGKGNKANPLDGVGKKLSAEDIKAWITHPVDMAPPRVRTDRAARRARGSSSKRR